MGLMIFQKIGFDRVFDMMLIVFFVFLMHCITTMINLVNLAAYIVVSFSPLIRLDSDTDM